MLEVRVVVEYAAGAGVGGSEVALGPGEVVVKATAGAGVGGSEVALGTGEVVVEVTAGAGVGGSEVALDTGEVVVEATAGAGVGGSEVTLDTGEVVVEGMARPGRDGAVESAIALWGTILCSAGDLLVVIVALLSEGKPWIGSCKMAFRMWSSAGCSASRRLSSARVRSWEGKSGERLRRGLLMGEPWTLAY